MVRTIPKRKIRRATIRQNGGKFRVGEWAQFSEVCGGCYAACIKPNTKVEILSVLDVQNQYLVNYINTFTQGFGTHGWVCAHHLSKVKRKKGLK